MKAFHRVAGVLHAEGVPLARIAEAHGTPVYVYSRAAIESTYGAYAAALSGRDSLVCYAMKANSNLAILDLLARSGSGFDIVSGGELARVLAIGADPAKIVFSGVGKRHDEIERALTAGIGCFNVESAAELESIAAVAERTGRSAPISVRVNPDVDARTHPYISTGLRDNKFGVAWHETRALYARARSLPSIRITGIDCHIGSQIVDVAPYLDAVDRILDLVDALAKDGIRIDHIDVGGGLGIDYRGETPPSIGEFVRAIADRIDARGHGDKRLLFEPGRSIVGNAGVLLAKVRGVKRSESKRFAIVDAAMNDLVRPAMYEAWMDVQPVLDRPQAHAESLDIVGPVCESGDWLARDRALALHAGDLVAIMGAGAYGMSMASNYNSRGRAAEVMVDGDRIHLIRERERVEDLYALERVLPAG